MTEAQAIADLNAAAAASEALKGQVTGAFGGFDTAAASLDALVSGVADRLSALEDNINYAIGEFL